MFHFKHGRVFLTISICAAAMACTDSKVGRDSTSLLQPEMESLFTLCQDFNDDSLYPLKLNRTGDRIETKLKAYNALNRYGQTKDQSMFKHGLESNLDALTKKSKSDNYSEKALEVGCLDHWSDHYIQSVRGNLKH